MSYPCQFSRTDNGWKCSVCGYEHRRPSNRPPVKRCKARLGETPSRKRAQYTPTSQQLGERERRPTHRPKRTKVQVTSIAPKPLELGDAVEKALTFVGITSERVTKWIGRPCKCDERKERLNNLSRWARRIASGKTENAKEYLEQMLDD